jgi:hypothetical protein
MQMQEIQITSSVVEEIRDLILSGNPQVLDKITPGGISLSATVSLCLSLDHWTTTNVFPKTVAKVLRSSLKHLSEAETVFSQHPKPLSDRNAMFASRAVEFFSMRNESHFPSLDWDNYCQRFKKGLTENGFSSPYALALANAFHEMADNVMQHSQAGLLHPSFSGLAGYHLWDRCMVFSVGDHGVGVLNTLRTNPRYSGLTNSEAALLAIYSEQATRKKHETFGGGFRQLFKSLADLNGTVRLRSGDSLLEYSGVSTRNVDLHKKSLIAGLEVSVICGTGRIPKELVI